MLHFDDNYKECFVKSNQTSTHQSFVFRFFFFIWFLTSTGRCVTYIETRNTSIPDFSKNGKLRVNNFWSFVHWSYTVINCLAGAWPQEKKTVIWNRQIKKESTTSSSNNRINALYQDYFTSHCELLFDCFKYMKSLLATPLDENKF